MRKTLFLAFTAAFVLAAVVLAQASGAGKAKPAAKQIK